MTSGAALRILHFVPTTRFAVGGTVRAAMDICSVLARRGQEITWMTTDDTDAPDEWKSGAPGCPRVARIDPLRRGRRLSRTALQTVDHLVQQADVVHIHALWSPCNAQLAAVTRRRGIPWVVSIHGVLDDWCMAVRGLKKRIYLKTAIRSMLGHASCILATAQEEKRQAARWLPQEPRVIPLVMDMEPYTTLPNPQLARDQFGVTEKPTVLFLSRIHEKKSIETLIDAAALLQKRGTPIRLLIAGTGDDAYLHAMQQRAQDSAVDDVEFLGMVVGDLKLSLYAMADLFALATQQENFGLVYPEAMLCGTPVITTRGTDIWRELQEAGMSIVDRTPEGFADGIAALLEKRDSLGALGLRGREHVQQWLAPDVIAQQYEQLYAEIIN